MNQLASFIGWFFELLTWVILVRVLLSWFGSPYNNFTRLIYQVADPILAFFARYIPALGPFDFSPIVAILAVQFVGAFLLNFVSKLT